MVKNMETVHVETCREPGHLRTRMLGLFGEIVVQLQDELTCGQTSSMTIHEHVSSTPPGRTVAQLFSKVHSR